MTIEISEDICCVCDIDVHPETVASVREFVTRTLERWGLDVLVEKATHEVSELLTNVLKHTSTTRTSVWLTRLDDCTIRLAVWDNDPKLLERRDVVAMPDPEALLAHIEDKSEGVQDHYGHWGFPLSARAAAEWGCEAHDREGCPGKYVWVELTEVTGVG